MASKKQINNGPTRQNNGDTGSVWKIDGEDVCCLGSFHKTLPHNEYGEVRVDAFAKLVSATRDKTGNGFPMVPPGEAPPCFQLSACACANANGPLLPEPGRTAKLTNPRAGLASDPLTPEPVKYRMPPAATTGWQPGCAPPAAA